MDGNFIVLVCIFSYSIFQGINYTFFLPPKMKPELYDVPENTSHIIRKARITGCVFFAFAVFCIIVVFR